MNVSDLVIAEVHERFSQQEAPLVLARLSGTEIPLADREPLTDRIFLAVLKLSDGNLAQVDRWIGEACVDWRDVLVAAGLAHDDWPQVLCAEGFRVPASFVTLRKTGPKPRRRSQGLQSGGSAVDVLSIAYLEDLDELGAVIHRIDDPVATSAGFRRPTSCWS